MSKLIAASAGLAIAVGAANAAELLIVDLSVANQVTINATTGASAITTFASSFNGVYLENFFPAAGAGFVYSNGVGNLTSVGAPSDGTPGLFRGTNDPGLNIWSLTAATNMNFTAGQQAFTGSATWNVTAAEYAALLAGVPRTGNIFANADTVDDLPANGILGTYRAVVPTPGAAALLGLGGLAATRRRR
jgi:MYXO-CTERM domain-containing protein